VQLVKEGVLNVVVKLLDNSTSVKKDPKCIISVIGAILEMGRKPHFEGRKVLVDLKVTIVIKETKMRFQEFSSEAEVKESADELIEESDSDEEKKEEKRKAEQIKKEEDEIEAMKAKIKEGLNPVEDQNDPDAQKKSKSPFTQSEIRMICSACDGCLRNLGYGIPPHIWDEACRRRKFTIDWNIIASGLGLDAFTKAFDIGSKKVLVTDEDGNEHEEVQHTEAYVAASDRNEKRSIASSHCPS